MATLLYVVVDPARGPLRWVNAGHLAAAARGGASGCRSFVEGGSSVPLGVLPFPDYQEVSIRMEPGSTVVLYTDGLVERPGEHIDVGLDRLATLVRDAPHRPSADMRPPAARAGARAARADDVALLVAAHAADGGSLPDRVPGRARVARLDARRCCGAGCATPEQRQEIAEVITACGEAATNAIEHAGGGGRTPFELSGRARRPQVEIAVRDFGAWRAAARRRSGARAGADARADGRGGGDAVSSGTTVRLSRKLDASVSRATEGPLDGPGRTGHRTRGEIVVAHVTGELDLAGAPSTGETIGAAVPTSARGLVVDFSELEFIDSSGVAMLFGLVRRLAAAARSCGWWRAAASRCRACSRSWSSTAPRRSTRRSTRPAARATASVTARPRRRALGDEVRARRR